MSKRGECGGAVVHANGTVSVKCVDCNRFARHEDLYVHEYGVPCDIEPSYEYRHKNGTGCKDLEEV